jgi:hypothetical protein
VLTTVFGLLAKARNDHAPHPRGLHTTGELSGTAPFPAAATVIVCLSEDAATAKPRVLSIALRIPTESGDWDLLLSSTGTGERTRLLPKFVRHWHGARLGTLSPYRYRDELVWFMAIPDGGEPPARFTIHASGEDADWRQVAAVTLNPQNGDAPPPAFDPELNRPPEMERAPRRCAARSHDFSLSYTRLSVSDAATAVSAVARRRVTLGANTRPAVSPLAIHTPAQNGHVSSSPIACCAGWSSRGLSLSSAWPAGSSYLVNGARSGLVTASLVSNRLALCVATPTSAVSRSENRSGSRTPVRRPATETAPARAA